MSAYREGSAHRRNRTFHPIWRTVADQKNLVYYFENTASPSLVWVTLGQIDFQPGSGVHKLTLVGKPDLSGNQTLNFEKAEAFKFLTPE
jgi:penicillin V acylase-like amidase (Ntn superfamily)